MHREKCSAALVSTVLVGGSVAFASAPAEAADTVTEVTCSSANTFRLHPKTGLDRCFTGHGCSSGSFEHIRAFFSGPPGGTILSIDHWEKGPGPNNRVSANFSNVQKTLVDRRSIRDCAEDPRTGSAGLPHSTRTGAP